MENKILIFVTEYSNEYAFQTKCAEEIKDALITLGYHVEIFIYPVSRNFNTLLEQAVAIRLLELNNMARTCIALGPFSNYVRHNRKILWVFGLFDEMYSLYNTSYGLKSGFKADSETVRLLTNLDLIAFNEACALFAADEYISSLLSEIVAKKKVSIVMPSTTQHELKIKFAENTNFITYCDIGAKSRLKLLIESFSHAPVYTSLDIFGTGTPEHIEGLKKFIDNAGCKNRVNFHMIEAFADLLNEVSTSTVVVFTGYKSSHASELLFFAQKNNLKVVTTSDSGVYAQASKKYINIKVVEPTVDSLSSALIDSCNSSRLEILNNKSGTEWISIAKRLCSHENCVN